MGKKVLLTQLERELPYARYYDLQMTELSEAQKHVLEAGPIGVNEALPIDKRNDLFLPGYQEVETGYCTMSDGTGYVANLTRMDHVTKDMFEWWFAWHALEDLRYRIWDPEDHFYARQQNVEKVLDASVPMREKTWGTTHLVMEDVGMGPSPLTLDFLYPSDLGYDEDKVGTNACATMFSAVGHSEQGVNAIMTHFVRETDTGIELRSRFWIGYTMKDGVIHKIVPDGVKVPVEVSRSLWSHCAKEFNHLANILPSIYAENRDRW